MINLYVTYTIPFLLEGRKSKCFRRILVSKYVKEHMSCGTSSMTGLEGV